MKSLLFAMALSVSSLAGQAQTCSAQSGPLVPRVIELYTSEGCSSCPPADRWLSGLRPGPGVIAAAFHVDYWNGLGWKDRFSSAAFTERQQLNLATTGSRYAYTPQLVVDGRDHRSLALTPPVPRPARMQLSLTVRGTEGRLSAQGGPEVPARVQLWWARVEDGHETRVRAGENRGETLRHDHVVRDYGRLPLWDPGLQGQGHWMLQASPTEVGHPSRWIAVATDAATGAVLQALALGC